MDGYEMHLECIRLALRMHERANVAHGILATLRIFEGFAQGKSDAEIIRAANEAISAAKGLLST